MRLVRISQDATKEKVNFGPKPDFISKLHGLKENNSICYIQNLCTLMNITVTIKQIITIPDIKNLDNYVLDKVIVFLGKHRIVIDPINPGTSFEDLFSCDISITALILIVGQGYGHYREKIPANLQHWIFTPF